MTQAEDVLGLSVREFVSLTAAKTPTPGGGSVAGVVGALGTALGEMALNFTRGKKTFAEHEDDYARLSGRLERARRMFQDLVADDMAAYRLYQETSRAEETAEKAEALEVAVAAAVDVPRQAAKLALAMMGDMRELAGKCNPWLITDLLAAAALAQAVVKLCDYNVRVNVPQVADKAAAAEVAKGSAEDVAKAQALLAEIEALAAEHLG